ncbi:MULTISPECIES: amidohydrolase family protein [Sorangium]|uniref:Amidohydrolase family protein n=1 Tax=Sorangium atrum TaxID=2995308 RepID=A0ABT5CAC0_9BACT|nr:amidohydrolase family protein [Sorangium aterium]MDC0682765.1 amidohydrolase family protein [Sorangium aterium]
MKILTSIPTTLAKLCLMMTLSPLAACASSSATTATPPGTAGDTSKAAAPLAVPAEKHGPILDTHIHLYQVTRPGGVVWPEAKQKPIYRDVLPPEYEAIAKQNGVIGTGIVEASPVVDDNFKVLEMTKGNDFFKFLVAQLEIGSPSFSADLARLAADPRVVGIRGFLWSPKLTLDAKQLASLEELAAKGMTLDIISRGTLNPKDKVEALATAVPKLRIIIDHLAGAKGPTPDPAWVDAVQRLAKHPNIYIKFSSFFDMYNPAATEDDPWKAPTDLAAYKAHFDVLMKAFGEDRLIWGSNWPVVDMGGSLASEIEVAELYLKEFGQGARDKVMYKNAQKFYARHP